MPCARAVLPYFPSNGVAPTVLAGKSDSNLCAPEIILSRFLGNRHTMRIKFDFVIAIRKIVRILNLTFRVRQASGSGGLIRIRCVPLSFHAAFAFVPLAPQDAFQRHCFLCDRHASA